MSLSFTLPTMVLTDTVASLVGYSRLVMFSFGFQQAYRRGLQAQDHIFFTKVFSDPHKTETLCSSTS